MQFVSRPIFSAIACATLLIVSGAAATAADKSDIIGKWNLDTDAMLKLVEKQAADGKIPKEQLPILKQVMSSMKMSFEFTADGKLNFEATAGIGGKQSKKGEWSVVSTKEKTLTLNTKVDDKSEEVMITVVGKDEIAIHPPKEANGPVDRLPLKRAKE